MHTEAVEFTRFIKTILPEYFKDKIVLDVGGGDINGNNRHLFENCVIHVNDVMDAPNVTVVSKTKDLTFNSEFFDTIISTECFEHDPEFEESWKNIYRMLKPNGLFFFTCAGLGRPEHGTRRTSPNDSYGTIGNIEGMGDYYRNLTEHDINKVLKLNENFSVFNTYYNHASKDLYFVGIKKMNPLPIYINRYIENTSSKFRQQ
jgi:SAM-dependent methyltransferase